MKSRNQYYKRVELKSLILMKMTEENDNVIILKIINQDHMAESA